MHIISSIDRDKMSTMMMMIGKIYITIVIFSSLPLPNEYFAGVFDIATYSYRDVVVPMNSDFELAQKSCRN